MPANPNANLRLSAETKKRLRVYAAIMGQTMSQVAERLIGDALDRHDKHKEQQAIADGSGE